MGLLTKFSLKNPVAVLILAVLLIGGGIYSFNSLKVDLLPDIEFPTVTVQSVYPGASPQDVNDKVTTPLEKKFKGLDSLDKLSSKSFESASLIQLDFPIGTDMDAVSQKIADLIKETKLPEGVEPEAARFNFGSFPILYLGLFAKGDVDLNKLISEQIQPELQRVPGINSVAVGGNNEELLEIAVDRDKAKAAGITLDSIRQQILAVFLSFPAGTITQDRIVVPVRVEQKFTTIEQLKSMTLYSNAVNQGAGGFGGSTAGSEGASDGGVQSGAAPASGQITLGEIAEIVPVSEQSEITRYDRKDSLALTITKKQGANTVEVAKKSFDILKKYKAQVEYAIVFDQASGIESSVNSLRNEGLFGALFASLAVLLFLRNFRATIITILSIPLSLLVASVFLARYNITLNVMTLGGMAIAVGRVVDDSIVVIENIFRRYVKDGATMDKMELTYAATKEMLKAITSSTLTTIVVFLPLGLVGGITGEFFLPFALTVVFALIASLIVALTIVPILARFAFSGVKHIEKESYIQLQYGRLIEWSLRRKGWVLGGALAILFASFFLVSQLGFTFIANDEQKLITVSVTLPASTEVTKTNELSMKVEEELANRATIAHVFAAIGSRDFNTGLKKTNVASYIVELKEEAVVKEEVSILQKKISDMVATLETDTIVSVQEVTSGGPPTNNNVDIDLYSDDPVALAKAAQQVEDELSKNVKLRYITNNYQDTQKQWVVKIDPEKANKAGVSAFSVLGQISDQTRPVSVGTLALDGLDRNVRLSYDKDVASKAEIEETSVFGQQGAMKLKDIASVEEVNAVSAIQKLDEKVYARVSAQVDDPNVAVVSAAVIEDMKDLKLPAGVSLNTGAGSQETTETFIQLFIAMAVAIGLVYIVMLVTFGKARIPFVILSSLLFIPVGAILGLWITGEPLSLSALIGVLMLIGIVVTNAIVLVDRVGHNREGGLSVRTALIEAGKTRLRPILMTAFATICAIAPLAFTANDGNLISKGLAVVVIGGLTTSTLLTLVIVPIVYEIFFRGERKREVNAGDTSTG